MEPWQASQFWVTYRDGFVRRGLPGEVLSAVTGGSPTMAQMTAAAIALSVAAAAAWAVLARAVWRVATDDARALAMALVVASPFAFSLLVRDIGRYDAIGIAAFVMFAAVMPHLGRPRWPVLAGMSAVTAAAVASQELLIAFLVPLTVVALGAAGWTGRGLMVRAAAVLAPGALVAVASVTITPSRMSLLMAVDAAHAAGTGTDRYHSNAISALTQTTGQALRHFTGISPITFGVCLLSLGGCWAATTTVLWYLLGRRGGRLFWAYAAIYASMALALSAVGIDYRRWWALAFAATVVTLLLLPARDPQPRVRGRLLLLASILAASVLGQLFPSYPWWDPSALTNVVLDARG
ncbi:MAG TPA: hypothetical protein VFO16_03590 [Pseudonocardiaceae bacterium]|nr:hypothetical protein [Pseudonocardiaceae bacterium]